MQNMFNINFLAPMGKPALLPADSVSWRVFKSPLTRAIGGIAATILELGEPRVRTGVWEYSTFKTSPMRRMKRTDLAAMVTVYAAAEDAKAMIQRVNQQHSRITGKTEEGVHFAASEDELLSWVHTTANWGFMAAYDEYIAPLSLAEKDQYINEGVSIAKLYGASSVAHNYAEVEEIFTRTYPQLEPSKTLEEFLEILRNAPLLPWYLKPAQSLLIKAAINILPIAAKQALQLQGKAYRLNRLEHSLLVYFARTSNRKIRADSIPVHACRRLGLPDNFLYS